MAAEITYAELRFKTESKSSGPSSDVPAAPKGKATPQRGHLCFPKMLLVLLLLSLLLAIVFIVAFIIFFQKYSQFIEEKKTIKGSTQKHTELECKRSNSTEKGKVWSCCPKNWKSFNSHCYFYPTVRKSWQDSKERCSGLEAHLVVITSKEEQNFLTQNMKTNIAYYVGLSDLQGKRHWEWVDQTPYNENATFWHPGEPSNRNERCVMLNYYGQWGWNDALCHHAQGSVCEMMNISL